MVVAKFFGQYAGALAGCADVPVYPDDIAVDEAVSFGFKISVLYDPRYLNI